MRHFLKLLGWLVWDFVKAVGVTLLIIVLVLAVFFHLAYALGWLEHQVLGWLPHPVNETMDVTAANGVLILILWFSGVLTIASLWRWAAGVWRRVG